MKKGLTGSRLNNTHIINKTLFSLEIIIIIIIHNNPIVKMNKKPLVLRFSSNCLTVLKRKKDEHLQLFFYKHIEARMLAEKQ